MISTSLKLSFNVYILPHFHYGLYCRAANITDNLCTKQGNSSIFGPKIKSGFKLRAGYSGARTVHILVVLDVPF